MFILFARIKLSNTELLKLFLLFCGVVTFFYIKGENALFIANILFIVLNATLLCKLYEDGSCFSSDFRVILFVIAWHAFLSAILDFILPSSVLQKTDNIICSETFLYVFYFTRFYAIDGDDVGTRLFTTIFKFAINIVNL